MFCLFAANSFAAPKKNQNVQKKPNQPINNQPKKNNQIKPLQNNNSNTFNFKQNTSVSGNLNGLKSSQCGVSIYTEANSANTALETTFSAGVSWSQKKCVNEKEIAEINLEIQKIDSDKEITIRKIMSQEKLISDCLIVRAKAIDKKQNPDKICKIPKIEEFDAIQ
jgi:hypothetical protein